METAIIYISGLQVIGAFIGTATAVWSEYQYLRAIRDGKIDGAEDAHLEAISIGLKYGMTIMLVTSLLATFASNTTQGGANQALTSVYWLTIVISLIIVFVSWSLARHTISFPLGSAIIFTGWWFLTFIMLGKLSLYTLGAGLAFFILMTGVCYGMLQYLRLLARKE